MIDSISEMKTGESPRRPKPSQAWNEAQMPHWPAFFFHVKKYLCSMVLLLLRTSTNTVFRIKGQHHPFISLFLSFFLAFYFYFYFFFFYVQHSLVCSMPPSYETYSVPGCCRARGAYTPSYVCT